MGARSGERLGPYRLRELLGEGGMGMVYLATGPGDRPVAVKVLRQGAPGEDTARQRLAREVDTMRRVRSPYVAEVLDADIEGDPPYIVTQYVAGRTLEDVVASDGPLTGQALATLAHGLACALAAIHAAGVVHRDLKPGNVMLVDGAPVLIDFGIAQAPDSTRITMTGMFMGTPGYLAPEVIEGGDSTPAADVHSWAATVAYAATGRAPFGTGQFQAIFYRIVHGQADLGSLPALLLPIVLAALSRDPASRPQAADLAAKVAALRPAELGLAPAGAVLAGAPSAYQPPWQIANTSVDLPPAPDRRNLTLPPPPPALPLAQPRWSGTRPMATAGRDDFADLLPPVRYQPASVAGPLPPPALAGSVPVAPGRPLGGSVAATPGPARAPLVLATMVGLVAISMLLPVAGTLAALASLVLLRAADLTARRLSRRRSAQGPRPGDAVTATAFFPWAVVRSLLRFVLLAPIALLCATAVAVLSVAAAGPGQLPRVVSYGAGALVACYCLGPGSAACRRPLSRFYGSVTRSAPAALLGTLGVVAIAIAVAGTAVTVAPGYWPADHFGNQLQAVATGHPVLVNVADVGRRLWHWLGTQLP